MTWFKVDDSFYDHPKVFDAPDSAMALWIRAGCWSARNLTDGFVPAKMPARLCDDPDTAIRELLDRGVWRRAKDGYRFHDWQDYQPSAEKVRATRARRAEAGRLGGIAKAGKQTASNLLDGCQGDAKQNPAPSRPVPSSVVSVVSQPADRNARGETGTDEILETIIKAIYEQTSRVIDPPWAAEIRDHILSKSRQRNPKAAYFRSVIEREPDAVERFLKHDRTAVQCLTCSGARRITDPAGSDAGPCPDCHPKARAS